MGQLRDWWPSKDALLKKSPALPVNVTCASPPLQLLEAAAILNEGGDPGSAHGVQNPPFVSPSQASPRTPIKLISSQDHKQELLRNLFNLPLAADRPHHDARAFSAEDDSAVNLEVAGSFAHLIQQVQSGRSPSSLQQPDGVPLSLFGKGSPPPTTYASSMYPNDESLKQDKIGVGVGSGAFEMQQRQVMPVVKEAHNHSIGRKEASECQKGQLSHGSLHKDGMEKSCSSHSMEKHSGKTHTLHNVEDHPINKESLSRREIHIYSERQRRKGMTHLYTTLLSLLPEAKLKTDRCKVLTDAIEYIQMLREQMEVLGSQKDELITSMVEHEGDHENAGYASSADGEAANSSSITGISDETKEEILSSADVAVRFCGREAFITLNSCKSKGVWSKILQILHEQELEIFNVTLSSGNEMDHHCIHARVPKASNIRAQQVEKMLQDLIVNHSVVY